MNLREIAREANLSLSTISLVLNNKPGVKRETRERVAALLAENEIGRASCRERV